MSSAAASTLLHHIHHLVTAQSLAHLTDRELLRRFAQQRDEDSISTIIRRHGPMVWHVCQRVLHNRHETEDAFQATFLILVRKAASARWHDSVGNWLYQVAFRVARQAKASTLRRQAHECKVTAKPAADPVAEITLREAQAVLDEELVRLPDRFRAPLVLCYLQNATRDEAARQLGWSLGTLKRRLESGRELLRVRLTRRGMTLSATLLAAALAPSASPAAVLSPLEVSTVKTALGFTASKTAAGVITPEVAELVEGAMKALWMTKLKLVATLVLALGLLTAGTGIAAHLALKTEPPETKQERPPQPPAIEGAGSKQAVDKEGPVDRFGDPLPEGALVRMGTVRMRHAGHVKSVAFAPNGKTFVSGGYDGMAYEWETASGKRLRRFASKEFHGVNCLAYSRDGAKIVTGDPTGIVQLFDAATGDEIVSFKGHDNGVAAVDFSADGKILASIGGEDSTIHLWNAATGKDVRSWKAHANLGFAATFSRDGKTLVSVGDDAGNYSAVLWDPATGKELHRIGGTRETSIHSVAFTPDSKTLVAVNTESKGGYTIQLWDVASGEHVRQFADVDHAVFGVAVAPDGKTVVATGAFKGDSTLWDMATGKVVARIKVTLDSVYSVAFSPDSKRVLLGCRDNSLHLYDLAAEKDVFDFASHSSCLSAVAFTADGKGLVTGGLDKSIRLWESTTGRPVRLFEGVDHWISSLALSPDDKLVAAGTVQHKLDDLTLQPLRVRFWDMTTGKELSPVEDTQGDVWSVAFAPDGKSVAARGTDGTVRLWDVATRKERCRLESKFAKDDSSRVVFSPDSKMVASRKDDEALGLWEAATGKLVREFRAPQKWLGSLSFSADGRTLAVGGGSTEQIRLWEVATGKLRRNIVCDALEGRLVALSPDGRTLAADAHIKGTRLWDLPSGLELGTFATFAPECLVFSPDGLRLASAESNGTALIWDVARLNKGRPVVKFSPDAKPDALWADLTGDDAEKAFQALWLLAPDQKLAASLLKDRVRPAEPLDRKRATRLIADLDANQFEKREQATRELEKLADLAEPLLRETLAGKPSAEVRQRIEQLLEQLNRSLLPLDQERALEVLEQSGGAETRQLLESLAKGAPEARLTKQAKATLGRLAKRSAKSP